MGKVLVIKGANFSKNSLGVANIIDPSKATYSYGMSDASYFDTKMNEAANLTAIAANDTINANVVGKTIVAFKVVSQGAGKTFKVAVYEYSSPSSTTGEELSELVPLYEETFTTTKSEGETEEFILTSPCRIDNVNQRFSILQNNAIMCHMGTYSDMVNYYKTSAGAYKKSQYNYMDKIFFDVKVI